MFESVIGLIGLGLSAAGAFSQYQGASAQTKALKEDEAIRQQAMNLDAQRRQRQLVREGAIARANATSGAVNQGAQFGTGLAGGLGQIGAQTASGLYYNQTSQTLGNRLFQSNQALYNARSESNLGEGLSSLGGGIIKNNDVLARVGTYAASKFS